MKSLIAILLLALPYTLPASDQESPDSINKKRLNVVLIGGGAAYAATIITLNQIWYKDKSSGKFHFFNDNAEWNQVDKIGHAWSGYQLSSIGYKLNRWIGLNETKSVNIGSLYGPVLLTTIEVFDGFSKGYGASYGDLIANTSGALLMWGQHKLWKGIRIHPKFSFHQTSFASKRPELLGYNLKENIIKDYNGQTYWLSFDISEFTKSNVFPKWLNIAVGYGADEMVYSRESDNQKMGFNSKRQYFLALDLDVSYLKSRKKWVNTMIFFVNMIRLPAPALEYNKRNGLTWHYIYF